MIWNRCFSAFVALALVLLFSGCQAPLSGDKFTCVDDVIRIGDSLKLSLSTPGETGGTTDKDLLVGSDGTVNLYLLGPTKAAGSKFSDFEKSVQEDYIRKKYYRQVTVTVKPGDRFYTVGGEVKAPGRQVYIGQTTVLRAVRRPG